MANPSFDSVTQVVGTEVGVSAPLPSTNPNDPMPETSAISPGKIDDDGQVIDSFFVEVDNAPEGAELPLGKNNVNTSIRPRITNRMWSGWTTLRNSSDGTTPNMPVMLLPADPDRQALHLRVSGVSTTDRIRFADDPGKLMGPATDNGAGYLVYATAGGTAFTVDDYTGPLWASGADINGGAIDATKSVVVSWAAPTGPLDQADET